MSIVAQSAAQKARAAGFKQNLRVRGRVVTLVSDNEDDNEHDITVLIDDIPMMADPDRVAMAMLPVYVSVSCLAGSVEDPRSVQAFSEGGKDYKVIEFLETAGDRIAWKWKCEAQRDAFPAEPEAE